MRPGAKGYKPIRLELDPMPEMKFAARGLSGVEDVLFLPVINERVPVFDGTFRISQDVKVSTSAEFWGSLGKDGKTFTIAGKLDYQACDKTTCFMPDVSSGEVATPRISAGSDERAGRDTA